MDLLAAAGSPSGSPVAHIAFFVVLSFVVALVTSAIRLDDFRRIAVETRKFFITIILVIAAFAVVVETLVWVFLRR